MKFSHNSKCLCKHKKSDHGVEKMYHESIGIFKSPFCVGCLKQFKYSNYECEKFRLDNLSYIEELAKKKNLI